MSFNAGPFKWYFGDDGTGPPPVRFSLGVLASAPVLTWNGVTAPITADVWGGQPIDFLNLGKTGFVEMICQESNAAGVLEFLRASSGSLAAEGSISDLGCPTVANHSRVLHAVSIDPTNNCSRFDQWVSYRATLAANQPTSYPIGMQLEAIPVRFELQPYRRNSQFHIFEYAGVDGIWNETAGTVPLKTDATDLTTFYAS